VSRSVPKGRLKVNLVQISFFRLCPSASTQAKVSHRPKLCHPDWSGPGLPPSRYPPRRRMRLSQKAARSAPTPRTRAGNPGVRRGGTCSFTRPHANADSVHPPPPKPRWAIALNFVIPTGADPDFLHRSTRQGDVCGFLRKPHEVRQRHNPGQEIRGCAGEGPAVSLPLPSKKKSLASPSPNPLPARWQRYLRPPSPVPSPIAFPSRTACRLCPPVHFCSRHESSFLYQSEPFQVPPLNCKSEKRPKNIKLYKYLTGSAVPARPIGGSSGICSPSAVCNSTQLLGLKWTHATGPSHAS
jgi:hypothetical protein